MPLPDARIGLLAAALLGALLGALSLLGDGSGVAVLLGVDAAFDALLAPG